jgi:hypothetical protein
MKKPRYQFLSKRERQAVDFATEELLLQLLEAGEVRIFNCIIGLIQDLKDVTGKISADHEKCLRLPLILFEAAVRAR